jgi:putative transposase
VLHYGTATQIRQQRAIVLTAAYHAHPERFTRKPPEPLAPPTSSRINPPDQKEATAQ